MTNVQTENIDSAADVHPSAVSGEPIRVRGEELAAKVKGFLHEGNVQRILVKNEAGRTIIEIPVSAGIIAAIVAPVLTAVAAIAALANDWQIEVHRSSPAPTTASG